MCLQARGIVRVKLQHASAGSLAAAVRSNRAAGPGREMDRALHAGIGRLRVLRRRCTMTGVGLSMHTASVKM